MENTGKMVDVKIACFSTDSKPRIKWYISAPGTMNDYAVIKCGQQAWVSGVIQMRIGELYYVLGAIKEKGVMAHAKRYTHVAGGARFVVIEADVVGASAMLAKTGEWIYITTVRDPLLFKCGGTRCSECPHGPKKTGRAGCIMLELYDMPRKK